MKMQSRKQNNPVLHILKVFLATTVSAVAVTVALLLVIAFMMEKVGISEKQVQLAVYAVYLLSALAAGFVAGKCKKEKKFMWGAVAGAVWFAVVLLLSLTLQELQTDTAALFPALVCMVGGGMLGGMVA